jgi:hypothetical protein
MSLSAISFAKSGGLGNGGDAVVCPDYVTFLDSYEALKMGVTIDLNNAQISSQTHRSMVSVATNRLAAKDKYMANKLYEYSMEMVNDLEQFAMFPNSTGRYKGKVMYLGPDAVGEISDSEHRTLPLGCELRQLVSQLKPVRRLDNRYEVNKKLWDKLSVVDQSMTILHEAWYRIMIEDGADDSKGARYMNALTASKAIERSSFSDYIQDLKTTKKKNYIIENNSTLVFDKIFKIELSKIELNDTQLDIDKVCTKSLTVNANIKKLTRFSTIHSGITKVGFKNVCFNNSYIESLTLPPKFSGKRINFVMENYLIRSNGKNAENGIIRFNENGTFKTLENLDLEVIYKLFYVCKKGRKKFYTFEKQDGCKGPYLHDDSRVRSPGVVEFDNLETPIGFKFPDTF